MRTLFTLILICCFLASQAVPGPNRVQTANSSNYDVIYHRISITVNPASSAAITNGSVTTYFRTTVANVSSIQFDLDGAMAVSSATYHGSSITKSQASSVLTLTIPNIAVKGTTDSVTVFYSGTPILAPAGGVPSGYNWKLHNSQYEIFTLDEPYTAHNWWPCKESLYDKIDSCVEMIVRAPAGYMVAGNGSLISKVPTGSPSGNDDTITTWKTFYPMATYGVNFAVANFQNYQFSITANGKTFPVMNYLFAENYNSTYQTYCNELKKIIPAYVSVLGVDYPFYNEKYGLAECTSGWGALEVPTMTFIASDAYDKYTVAHEAAHQWFGDMVTTNSWHQIWLNEGFAQYFQQVIFPENVYPSELAAQRANLKGKVSTSNYTTYVTDTTSPNSIFIGSTTEPYEKGAMILSMLRSWIGDAGFFTALKNYLNAPGIKHGFTSVDTLQKYMQQQTTLDLSNFFSDWVYKGGRVTYAVKYQFVTKGVYIQLTQSPTASGQGYFDMPVPIRIQNGSGLDTTVVIVDKRAVLYNNVTGKNYATNTIYFPLSQTPTVTPTLDPNSVVLATSSSMTSSATLSGLITLPFKEIKLNAVVGEKNIKVNWSVNTDESLQFIVLEKSTNSVDFVPVQTNVSPIGSNNIYQGVYNDLQVESQQYYRLKIIKTDGSFIYSNVESVKGNLSLKLIVAPNPAYNELNVSIPADFSSEESKLVVYNFSGQEIQEIRLAPGNVKVSLAVKNLKPGMYNIQLVNRKEEKLQTNFVKE